MAAIDDELSAMDHDIKALTIEYDCYFSGGRKRPPNDIEFRVQQVIKKYETSTGKLNATQRFRFQSITSKYLKMSELWRKRMKAKEEGIVTRHFGAAARQLEVQRATEESKRAAAGPSAEAVRAASAAAARAALHHKVGFSDVLKESEKVQELYRTLMDAKKSAGEKADMSYEQFHKFVQAKTDQLKKQTGGKGVEYSVSIEGGQVKLKAKGV